MDQQTVAADEYPEMGKASFIADQYDVCYNLILWMADEKGISLAVHKDDRMVPLMETTDNILMQFFGIDKDALTKERLRAIEDLRKFNATQTTTPSDPQARIGGAV